MRYIVIDEPKKNRTGDVWTKEFNELQAAIQETEMQTKYLIPAEKENRRVYVLESVNADEDAENHLDGDVVWEG